MSVLAEAEMGRASKARSFVPSPRAIASAVVTFGLIASWAVFLRPQFFGGSTSYVLVSGESMEPTLSHGDFVIARKQDTYEKGDVVVYSIPEGETGAGGLVIHRITGGSAADGYILQGDNRTTPDLWRPSPGDIAGTPLFTIPKAGKVIPYLRSPYIAAAFAGYMAFLFVYLGGKDPESSEEDAPAQPTASLG